MSSPNWDVCSKYKIHTRFKGSIQNKKNENDLINNIYCLNTEMIIFQIHWFFKKYIDKIISSPSLYIFSVAINILHVACIIFLLDRAKLDQYFYFKDEETEA
jgi:hypothetical protein